MILLIAQEHIMILATDIKKIATLLRLYTLNENVQQLFFFSKMLRVVKTFITLFAAGMNYSILGCAMLC